MSTPCPGPTSTFCASFLRATATSPDSTKVEVCIPVTSIAHLVPRTEAIACGVRIWNSRRRFGLNSMSNAPLSS